MAEGTKDKKKVIRIKREGRETNEQSGKLIGELQQALIDALNKRVDEIFNREGVDKAYWQFSITLTMDELDVNFKPLHTTVIESKNLY